MHGWIKRAGLSARRRLRCWRATLIARRLSRSRLSRLEARRILVVCYGNVCRSPLAAELLRRELDGMSEVRSGGLREVGGRSSPPDYIALCASTGIGLQDHRSLQLSTSDIEWADAIVIMDRHNWHLLVERGVKEDCILWLGAFDDGSVEIADPFGRDTREVANTIARIRGAQRSLASWCGKADVEQRVSRLVFNSAGFCVSIRANPVGGR
jgi:protein-tyrosine phosphatase